MPRYTYEAKDRFGVIVTSELIAVDPDDALRQLRDGEYEPISIAEIQEATDPAAAEFVPRSHRPEAVRPPGPPRDVDISAVYPFMNPWTYFGIAFALCAMVFGAIAGGAGAPGIVQVVPALFVAVGLGIAAAGVIPAAKRLRAWQHGEVAEGRVVSIGQDRSLTINGRHPFSMGYEFDVGGTIHSGRLRTFNKKITSYDLDDALWVTYLPDDVSVNAVWPPLS